MRAVRTRTKPGQVPLQNPATNCPSSWMSRGHAALTALTADGFDGRLKNGRKWLTSFTALTAYGPYGRLKNCSGQATLMALTVKARNVSTGGKGAMKMKDVLGSIRSLGVVPYLNPAGGLVLGCLDRLPADRVRQAVALAKQHKGEIINALKGGEGQVRPDLSPEKRGGITAWSESTKRVFLTMLGYIHQKGHPLQAAETLAFTATTEFIKKLGPDLALKGWDEKPPNSSIEEFIKEMNIPGDFPLEYISLPKEKSIGSLPPPPSLRPTPAKPSLGDMAADSDLGGGSREAGQTHLRQLKEQPSKPSAVRAVRVVSPNSNQLGLDDPPHQPSAVRVVSQSGDETPAEDQSAANIQDPDQLVALVEDVFGPGLEINRWLPDNFFELHDRNTCLVRRGCVALIVSHGVVCDFCAAQRRHPVKCDLPACPVHAFNALGHDDNQGTVPPAPVQGEA